MGGLFNTQSVPSNVDRAALAKILDVIHAYEYGDQVNGRRLTACFEASREGPETGHKDRAVHPRRSFRFLQPPAPAEGESIRWSL
jgi:hypothetical protein